MINRKNLGRLALAVTAIAICFVLAVGAAAALAPASSDPSSEGAEAYGGPAGYFPAQLLGHAREFEAMPDIFD